MPRKKRPTPAPAVRATSDTPSRTTLFPTGNFVLRSGQTSSYKVECDALTPADWAGLARMAFELLPPFSRVRGVPTGGIPFALALREYATNDPKHPFLVAEDVVTTGGSMERFLRELYREGDVFDGLLPRRGETVIGVAAFARGPSWPDWVRPVLCVDPVSVLRAAAAPPPVDVVDRRREEHRRGPY